MVARGLSDAVRWQVRACGILGQGQLALALGYFAFCLFFRVGLGEVSGVRGEMLSFPSYSPSRGTERVMGDRKDDGDLLELLEGRDGGGGDGWVYMTIRKENGRGSRQGLRLRGEVKG